MTILSVVFVLVFAGGLAAFMYPLVFVHPEGSKWTMRVAFFGFYALTVLQRQLPPGAPTYVAQTPNSSGTA